MVKGGQDRSADQKPETRGNGYLWYKQGNRYEKYIPPIRAALIEIISLLWHTTYFLFFLLFNSLYYYCSLTTDNFTSYLFPFTYDSFWLSTNTLLWLSISTIVSWLTMTPLLYVDSGWVVYCTLTHNESFFYCLQSLLFTWLIVLRLL